MYYAGKKQTYPNLPSVAAEQIGMDPLEFRLKNLTQIGDPGPFGPSFTITSTAMAECIKIGAERIGWKEKRGKKQEGIQHRGIGVSCMAHSSSAWPVHAEHSNAVIKINEDASVVLSISPPPMGNNAYTSLAQVAAEVLGIPFDDVYVVYGDTDAGPWEVGSHASRTMYVVGNAVYQAALEARAKLLNRAAKLLGVGTDELEIKDKIIHSKTNPEKCIPANEVTKRGIYSRDDVEQIRGACSFSPVSAPPPYQAVFAEVDVDTKTGVVKVLRIVVANDSGIAINPMIVEGHLQGGTSQALGYALWENHIIDTVTGNVLSDNYSTYKIAAMSDMPEVDIIHVEGSEPTGPFGAKGVGEPGAVNHAPAIANAIYDAVGIRLFELPMSPEKVLKAIKEKGT